MSGTGWEKRSETSVGWKRIELGGVRLCLHQIKLSLADWQRVAVDLIYCSAWGQFRHLILITSLSRRRWFLISVRNLNWTSATGDIMRIGTGSHGWLKMCRRRKGFRGGKPRRKTSEMQARASTSFSHLKCHSPHLPPRWLDLRNGFLLRLCSL